MSLEMRFLDDDLIDSIKKKRTVWKIPDSPFFFNSIDGIRFYSLLNFKSLVTVKE
jgi:hypothetical protein